MPNYPFFKKVGSLVPPRNVSIITRPGIKAESAETSVATAQPVFLSENGHCVADKIPKILKIFKGVDGAKSRGACFGTKELDHPFLGYSDGFDLAHGLAPNQSHVNNPGMDDPIP